MINYTHLTPQEALIAYNESSESYKNCIDKYLNSTNEQDKEVWKKQAQDGLAVIKNLENDLCIYSMPFNTNYREYNFEAD